MKEKRLIMRSSDFLSVMEEKKDQVEDEDDFDKIIARYRMAISNRDVKENGKKMTSVDKTIPSETIPPKKEEPVPNILKPPQQEAITSDEMEKYFEWVKVIESAIQNCISQSKGSISSINVLLPDGITCLSSGLHLDIDEDVLAAFIGEQFELLESYGDVLKIGDIEEIEYIGKQSVILMKSKGGLRLMAMLNDKRYARLAKIYLERMLKSIPRLQLTV